MFPNHPFFVERLKIDPGGVDFLGMRQATLDLREKCLPGFSNSTELIRPFSVMCWVYWKLNEIAKSEGLATITTSQARSYREKAEVLFTWGHKLKGFEGLPGISFGPPQESNGTVSLTFADWHRIPSSTGLMAAVNYGPALKTTIGLGFLNPIENDVFQPVRAGVALAHALDQELQKHGLPSALHSMEVNVGTAADALRAFAGWSVAEPSAKERAAFRDAFYDAQGTDSRTAMGLRSATVALILEVLKRTDAPLTVDEIREHMFWGPSALSSFSITPSVEAARKRWIVFLVRQAQRIAMEALLSWVEKRIIMDGDSTTDALARAGQKACVGDSDLAGGVTGYVERRLGHAFRDLEQAIEAGATTAEVSIFHLMRQVRLFIRNEVDEIIPAALRLLGVCREYTIVMEEVAELRSSLRHGGAEALSLVNWRETIDRTHHLDMKDFLLVVIEELVLSQHLAVATRRYDGGVVRLRVTLEEEGLRALVAKPWKPAPAADKLASGLSLMAECGLVERAAGGRYVAS